MLTNLFIFVVSLFLIIRSSTLATKYSAELAENFHLSKYTVGFIVIAIISILPETFIALDSALEGVPSFGLGTLFGSNVADLTLVFSVILFTVGKNIKIESKILKNNIIYPFLLLVPIILGFDGFYTRAEGITLLIVGIIFYAVVFKNTGYSSRFEEIEKKDRLKNFSLLVLSMFVLLIGAHFTVNSAVNIANILGINVILIGIVIVAVGTTLPELLFSIGSVKEHHESMAVGDLLGTVLADATIVVGILALVHPFSFPTKIVYSSGIFMVIASFLLFYFMRSERKISKKEGLFLFLFWLSFVIAEFFISNF